MSAPREVSLEAVTPATQGILANLLHLYIHDLSDLFSIDIGADGRFAYEKLAFFLPHDLQLPDAGAHRHFAYLIRCEGRPAGFALVTREASDADDPGHFDVTEFFVLRRHRRSGVGRDAALQLWNLLPGAWTVRVSEANRGALAFWRAAVEEHVGGAFTETRQPVGAHGSRVLSFQSPRDEQASDSAMSGE